MRNKGYVKRGTVIDVQIKDEYFASAAISPTNKERTEFKYDLSIHNEESGMFVEIDKSDTLSSTYKTVNKEVTEKLNTLIDTGYFDASVEDIKNMMKCLDALLELQKKIIGDKEN